MLGYMFSSVFCRGRHTWLLVFVHTSHCLMYHKTLTTFQSVLSTEGLLLGFKKSFRMLELSDEVEVFFCSEGGDVRDRRISSIDDIIPGEVLRGFVMKIADNCLHVR